MAVPESMTVLDISGRYTLNRTLSDDTNKILTLQGVPWWKRIIINRATITLDVKHYKDDGGIEHIDIDQTLTGGLKGTTEQRTLDGVQREHKDDIFGSILGRSRRVPVEELKEEWLKAGWTEGTLAHPIIDAWGTSDTEKSGLKWTVEQTWGFQVHNDEKRYARNVHFFTPEEEIKIHMVYDYVGPVPA